MVHYLEWDVPVDLVTWHQLGETAWELRHWVRRAGWGSFGLPVDMGERCVPEGVFGDTGSVQQRSSAWSNRSGSHIWQLWPRSVCVGARWWFKCPGRDIQQFSGQWVPAKADRLPSFWSPSVWAMPAADCLYWFREFRRLLYEAVHCQLAEKWWNSALHVFSPRPRKAIVTKNKSMPHLVDVVANIFRVWPLIVSDQKETGRKDAGDSLVVRSSSFFCISTNSDLCILYLWCLEQRDGQLFFFRPAPATQVPVVPHAIWDLWVFSFVFAVIFFAYVGVPDQFRKISRNALVLFVVGSPFSFEWRSCIIFKSGW